MRTVTVSVTQEDIDKGVPGDCFACPIARAFHRCSGGRMVAVGAGEVVLDGQEILLPPAIVKLVDRIDTLRPVQPFTFTLEVPE